VSDAVLVEQRGNVLLITINRPEAKNALNADVARGVAEAVDRLDADPELRCGVLTGAGGTFSAGMDLKAFLAGETPLVGDRGLCGITAAPPKTPLVAAVEGWALAGGFELMLACDLVVASTAAKFGVPEVKRGLVAGAGGAFLLAQRIPRAVALELLLTGDPFDADKAERVGLINKLVEPGTAVQAACELAETIAANGPLAVATTKAVALDGAGWSPGEGDKAQARYLSPVFRSEDAREGARAFAERRAPVWQGR
jgi:enoyl-CoA hydratase